jgi:hypothetical protein
VNTFPNENQPEHNRHCKAKKSLEDESSVHASKGQKSKAQKRRVFRVRVYGEGICHNVYGHVV